MKFWALALAVSGFASQAVYAAAQFPVQARLFAGATSANPSNINEQMTTLGFKEFKTIPKYGAEATYSVARFLDFGFRYEKRYMSVAEENPTPNSDSSALLDQDAVLLIARVPIIESQFVRFDIFGGVGGTNTTLKIKTSTIEGELKKRESGDWFASLITSVGASLALGYKSFFVVFEGGAESNKVESFKRSGNINDTIQTADLSGGYFTVGLMFDGLTATSAK